jgi:hypothetical protein
VEAGRSNCRRRLFVLTVIVSDEPTYHNRPARDAAIAMARTMYPEASVQRIEEVLWVDTSYPFGDLERWTVELANAKLQARTVYSTPCEPPSAT